MPSSNLFGKGNLTNKQTQEDEEFFKEKEKDVSNLIEEGMSMSEIC